jgi:hypothetical protein
LIGQAWFDVTMIHDRCRHFGAISAQKRVQILLDGHQIGQGRVIFAPFLLAFR